VPMAGKAGELRIPLTLQRSRLKAEEKTLDFEFEVVSAQFNQQGRYALRLTVENPLLQGSSAGVRLCINSREVIQSSTGTTDTIEQSDLNQIYSFQRRKFTFILPRAGFCKNDNNHDVRLHIEALHFPRRAERMRRSRQVGEAFFAIYPRTNQPRMKLSARKDEDWYRYSSVMALLRVGSEQPAMHCGRLAFTASLHEHRPPTTLVSPPPLSPSTQEEDQQAAGTAPASPPLDIPIPSCSPRTPESAYHSLPTEGRAHSPKVGAGCHALMQGSQWQGRSPSPKPAPILGAGLAKPGQWSLPVTLPSQAAARSAWTPSFIPLDLTSPSNRIRGESIKARLVGGKWCTQSRAREMRDREITLFLPAASGRGSGRGCRCAGGALPSWHQSQGQHQAAKWLLASLCAHRTWVPTSCPPSEGERWAELGTDLLFPPTQVSVRRTASSSSSSSPCRSTAFHPGDPPPCPKLPLHLAKMRRVWPTHGSFPSHPSWWHIRDMDGGTGDTRRGQPSPGPPSLPLSPHPSILQTVASLPPQRPAAFLTPSGSDALPSPGPADASTFKRGEELRAAPVCPFSCQVRTPESSQRCQASTLPACIALPAPTKARTLPPSSALGWQEASSYRLALKRMAGDLLSLRQHVTSLEVENRHLRRSLASREELGHTLLADWHGAVAATLKHKLVAGTVEMRRLKDRVQRLQNELIRKNDQEKDLVLLQRAHQQQQAVLKRCQEKVAKTKNLEETVRQQEKVIEAMERVLQEKLARAGRSTENTHPSAPPSPHPTGEALSGEVYAVLLAENRRLREDLARPPHLLPPVIPQPPTLPGGFGRAEKLSLLARLEEAQAQRRVLERQLEEAARKWGREKQELGTRLLEREHGF
ncbi:CCD33 protein, partial [Haliaeetus albicilla]|nr:CCD33 protein [Haliaeetus albicilla]